jgi:sensor histidine kinase regulating citrate/malate metabolism
MDIREFLNQRFLRLRSQFEALKVSYSLQNPRPIQKTGAELIGLLIEIMCENAQDATAKTIDFSLIFSDQTLTLIIQNDGPKLPDELQVLMQAGYSQNKADFHLGMGLFLARLVLETLHGSIKVLEGPGVHLKVEFPLENLVTP